MSTHLPDSSRGSRDDVGAESTAGLQAEFSRLASLHREMADALDRLRPNLATLLAGVRVPSVMEPVTGTTTSDPAEAGREILTQQEVAELLRIDRRTLRLMRKRGDAPPSFMLGERPRWRRADVDAWIANRGAS